jgi:Saxitoxin biosynthesis operon protein SxtJ
LTSAVSPTMGASAARAHGPASAETARRRRELREFGLIVGGLFAGVFGLLLPWLHHRGFPLWPWIAAVALAGSALVRPTLLGPVFIAWTKVGHVLGWVNTRVILTLIFFTVLTPMGALMRLLGYEPMARGADPTRDSYRVPSRQITRKEFERPF